VILLLKKVCQKLIHKIDVSGAGLSGYWVRRTLNTVRRVILKKGGKHVTLVTYGLFGPYNRHCTVPVQHVSQIDKKLWKECFRGPSLYPLSSFE
jgi:hypothetical protein